MVRNLPLNERDGVLDLSADQYHADAIGDTPTLSRSIAHVLCAQSPLHAWTDHPRLNPNHREDDRDAFDVGTISHSILLQGDVSNIEVVEANDWRTKDAQTQRDEARAAGRTPILAKNLAAVHEMVDAAREQLAKHEIARMFPAFTAGHPEVTLSWTEPSDVVCRARLDYLRDDQAAIFDYKTAANAKPEKWTRGPLFDHGLDVQAAWYSRAVQRVYGGRRPAFFWVVQEKTPPYALIVVTPGADVLAIGEAKMDTAIRLWGECLAADSWPAYSASVIEAELPAWAEDAKWLVEA